MAFTQNYSVFVPEIWSPRVTEFFKERLTAAGAYTNISDEVAEGGDTVWIPDYGDNFTANDVNTTSGNVSVTSFSETRSKLTIDSWKADSFIVTDFERREIANRYTFVRTEMRGLAHSLARAFDSKLLDQWENFDNTLGDSSSNLTSTNFELALSILDSNSVPVDELTFMIHPRQHWGDIFKRQKYYDASQFGASGEGLLPTGTVTTLYGRPVVRTEQIPESSGSLVAQLVHPETVWFALGTPAGGSVSNGVRLQEFPNHKGELRTKVVGDIIYGLTTVRSGASVAIKTDKARRS